MTSIEKECASPVKGSKNSAIMGLKATSSTKSSTSKYKKISVKKCSRCHEVKPRSAFFKDGSLYRTDGLTRYCKACSVIANRELRARKRGEKNE